MTFDLRLHSKAIVGFVAREGSNNAGLKEWGVAVQTFELTDFEYLKL